MKKLHYDKNHQKKIEFPLGGIGTGNISLTGIGELINFEMFSDPNKESTNGYSFFAVKAEREDGKLLDARIMHGDIQENFYGSGLGGKHSWGYGHGPSRTTLCGFPHFENTDFYASFPFADIDFEGGFPGEVNLEAFNPFIPSNDKDSSLPIACFTAKVKNTEDYKVKYTVAFCLGNPYPLGSKNAEFALKNNVKGVTMTGDIDEKNPKMCGSVSISCDGSESNIQEYWYRGAWFDDLTVFWSDFTENSTIPKRHYDEKGKDDNCTLTSSVTLNPGETKELKFLLSWYVPTYYKTWERNKEIPTPHWDNYIKKLFDSHEELISYVFESWDRLKSDSMRFTDALCDTSMPDCAIEAVQDNLAILKSPTCKRLSNGEFYAFEGTNRNTGSCEGSCTHVWNYAYALPFLFPNLERSMRELDYTYNQDENGGMHFRIMLPLGSQMSGFRPCVDGEMGGVLKFYRDFKISGDVEWLKKWWHKVKLSLEYAWSPNNPDKWDPDMSGVITGRQHNTLDIELFGANSWLESMYIGALMAGSEMADIVGEKESAELYRTLAEKGKAYMEKELFNGKHYVQKLDLKCKDFIDSLCGGDGSYYYDSESGECKYQYIDGCEIDQMIGQYHTDLIGLGNVFDEENMRVALKTLYKNNFKSMRNNPNPCRVFAVNGESGLVMCTWSDGDIKPRIPTPYSQENMTGFEYAAADVMLNHGLEDEAINIVKSIRERYDGEKRNPFSEMECGSSYARAMASYSLLLSYSGFSYNMQRKNIGFNPKHLKDGYRTLFATDGAWGNLYYENKTWKLEVLYGKLTLKSLDLLDTGATSALLKGANIPATVKRENNMQTIEFKDEITINRDEILTIC